MGGARKREKDFGKGLCSGGGADNERLHAARRDGLGEDRSLLLRRAGIERSDGESLRGDLVEGAQGLGGSITENLNVGLRDGVSDLAIYGGGKGHGGEGDGRLRVGRMTEKNRAVIGRLGGKKKASAMRRLRRGVLHCGDDRLLS